MSCCAELNDRFDGAAVKDISELHSRLKEIDTDFKTWVTTFRCATCGQVWIEQYKGKGHGEVPEVYKQK